MACEHGSDSNNGTPKKPTLEESLKSNYKKFRQRWRSVTGDQKFKCNLQEERNTEKALQCAVLACQNAGGIYDKQNYYCKCDSQGLVFNGEYASCLPPKIEDLSSNHAEKNRAEIDFEINQSLGTSKQKIFDLLEGIEKMVDLKFPYSFKQKTRYQFFEIDHLDDRVIEAQLGVDPDGTSYTGGLNHSTKSVLEVIYEESQLENYIFFNNMNVKPIKLNKLPGFEQFHYDLQNLDYTKSYKSFTQNGCADICYIDEKAKLKFLEEDVFVIKRNIISAGNLRQRKIYLSKSSFLEDAFVVLLLDRSGNLNLAYKLSPIKTSAGTFTKFYDVFTKNAELIKSGRLELDYSLYHQTPPTLRREVSPSTVMVCEYGVLPSFPISKWASQIVVGPHYNKESKQGSLWGWLENNEGSEHLYFDGAILNQGNGKHTKSAIELYATHHMDVLASTAMVSPAVTVTASSVESCFSTELSRNPLLNSDFKGRIVNLSLSFSLDKYACDKVVKQIKQQNNRLFIQASGNDKNTACDKRIQSLTNVIAVAAMDADSRQVHRYSVKGRNSVHTAALKSSQSDDAGTSFAAPVVSGIASKLLDEYPNLSALDLKKALLLGVSFNYLPVWSGGNTNLQAALKVARAINMGEERIGQLVSAIYPLEELEKRISHTFDEDELDQLYEDLELVQEKYDDHLNWLENNRRDLL